MQTVSRAEVIEIKNYSDNLKEFVFKLEKYRRYDAGTFLQLTLENVTASERWPESRTFSIASAYNSKNKTIKLLIRKVGKYTDKIFNELRIGEICTVKYSFGEMLLPQFDDKNSIVCIAGGTGLAPFLSFIEELKSEEKIERLKLFYSVRKESDFISYDYLINTISKENLKLFCTDRQSNKGIFRMIKIEDILEGLEDIKKAHYYICGAPKFIIHFRDKLKEKGIEQIYLDEWE